METMKIKVDVQGAPMEVALLVKPGSPKNPSVLALHGLQTCKSVYEDLFSQSFMEDYSCMAIDFIGFGESEKSEDFSYEIQDQLEVVIAVIERLGMGKFHLIGHSLGGMVGTLLAQDLYKQVVSFANLEGNMTLKDSSKSKEVAGILYQDFMEHWFPNLKKELKGSKNPAQVARGQWLDLADPAAFYETCQSTTEWTTSEKLKTTFNELRVPKIFVCGEENSFKSTLIEDESIVRLIPDSGHFMLQDNPKMTCKVIKQFLEDVN